MSDELKPCPFCGGKAKLKTYGDRDVFWAECPKCYVKMPMVWEQEKAIRAWNTRVEKVCRWTQGQVDDYWTSACDYAFTLTDEVLPAENDFLYCPKCGGKIEIGEERE